MHHAEDSVLFMYKRAHSYPTAGDEELRMVVCGSKGGPGPVTKPVSAAIAKMSGEEPDVRMLLAGNASDLDRQDFLLQQQQQQPPPPSNSGSGNIHCSGESIFQGGSVDLSIDNVVLQDGTRFFANGA